MPPDLKTSGYFFFTHPLLQEPEECEKEFSNHKVEKHPKCDVCNSVFKSEQNLKSHIQSVHEGKKPFKCNICDASFTRKATVNSHIASVHEKRNLKRHSAFVQ